MHFGDKDVTMNFINYVINEVYNESGCWDTFLECGAKLLQDINCA
jgi:hypothetical protein